MAQNIYAPLDGEVVATGNLTGPFRPCPSCAHKRARIETRAPGTHPGNHVAVASDIFGGRVHYDIRTEGQRLTWSPEGRSLVTVGRDKIERWDAASGKRLASAERRAGLSGSGMRILQIKGAPEAMILSA